ncbi:putative GNAT family N-acyltransferase [Oxalobacteraceae bacterium GrIS 1.11]
MPRRVTPLAALHDLSSFSCGNVALDGWLQTIARQHQKNSISQTFILASDENPDRVLGFYALALRAMTSGQELPAKYAKRLPRQVPGITLGRLAIQEDEKGKRYGEELLVNAMRRARDAALRVGGWALFVDAKDEAAATFYRKYGFTPSPSNRLLLFMPVADMPQ